MALKDRVKQPECPLFEARQDGAGCVSLLANDACARPEQFFCEDPRALTPLRITKPAQQTVVPAQPANDAPARPPRPNTPTRFIGTDLLGNEVWEVESQSNKVAVTSKPLESQLTTTAGDEMAPANADAMEAHLQVGRIGDVWVVPEHTDSSRVELTPANVRLLQMCLSIFPDAKVMEIRKKPKT